MLSLSLTAAVIRKGQEFISLLDFSLRKICQNVWILQHKQHPVYQPSYIASQISQLRCLYLLKSHSSLFSAWRLQPLLQRPRKFLRREPEQTYLPPLNPLCVTVQSLYLPSQGEWGCWGPASTGHPVPSVPRPVPQQRSWPLLPGWYSRPTHRAPATAPSRTQIPSALRAQSTRSTTCRPGGNIGISSEYYITPLCSHI